MQRHYFRNDIAIVFLFLFFLLCSIKVSALDVAALEGIKFHPGAKKVQGRNGVAYKFSGGGIDCPMPDEVSAASGGVDLWCRIPKDWSKSHIRTLFHIAAGKDAYVNVSYFKGKLNAIYKNGKVGKQLPIRYRSSLFWAPGSWHHIKFSWMPTGSRVLYWLSVDNYVVGVDIAEPLDQWPEEFFVGCRPGNKHPWWGLLERVQISSALPAPGELNSGYHSIDVYANKPLGKCYNFWSTRNFTNQDMFAKPENKEEYLERRPFMKYVNCVRLIGGRNDGKNQFYKGVDSEGNIQCDFTDMIKYLQGILDWGLSPRIVLDNIPTALSEPAQMHKYGNTCPPKDYKLYHAYIKAVVQAMVDAFGIDVVRGWRFRVMTEPDLYPNHWAGTKQEYFKVYDYAVDAVTAVIPDADIGPGNILNPDGNPHQRSNMKKWGPEMIDHAGKGKNHCTGDKGTGMSFFSCTWYGQVGSPVDYFETAICNVRARLDVYPQFRDVPVEVAEFGVLLDEQRRMMCVMDASEWAASWFAAIAERVYRLGVNRVHLWWLATEGIWHAQASVISMLERMADCERLMVETSGPEFAECGAIACRKDDKLLVLLYHHRRFREPKVRENITVRIWDDRMVENQRWNISEWRVDAEHGTFIRQFIKDCRQAGMSNDPNYPIYGGGSVWKAFGRAGYMLFEKNREKYKNIAGNIQRRTDEPIVVGDKCAVLEINMPAHSVSLFQISPPKAK